MEQLGQIILPVEARAPQADEPPLRYIDLSSVNNETKSIEDPRFIDSTNAPSRARQRVRSGDVLVSTVRPNLNGVAVVPDALDGAIASTGFSVLRANESRILSRYLFHWVRSDAFVSQMTRLATGASYPAVSDAIVRSSCLPLPTLNIQAGIAARLDRADGIRLRRSQSFPLLDELFQSIYLQTLATDRETQSVSLDRLGRVVTGMTPPASRADMFGEEVPFVTPGDLESRSQVKRYLSAAGVSTARVAPAGSVLVCCIGATIGKVGLVRNPSAFNQQINAVVWGDRILPEFGFFAVKQLVPEIKARSSSTTMPILKKSSFERLAIPVPPLATQAAFVRLFDKARSVHELARTHEVTVQELVDTLSSSAFAGVRHV